MITLVTEIILLSRMVKSLTGPRCDGKYFGNDEECVKRNMDKILDSVGKVEF